MSVARLLAALIAASAAVSFAATDDLLEGFRHPPADARPQTWWHWMNGNISREGITADLEAMQRIGLGGAQIFNATQGEAPGPVKVLSPEWYSLVKHAIAEADRLGLQITMHNCMGWSESGGPWVTPADAMQRVVWSETRVHGGQALSVALPPPPLVVADYFRDIAVLAFPASPAETESIAMLAPKITANVEGGDVTPLFTHPGGSVVELPMPTPDEPRTITLEFKAPQRCGSVRFVGREYLAMPLTGRIMASDDGKDYRFVTQLPILARGRNHPSMLVTFPEITTRFLRLVVTKVDARAKALVLTAIELGGARLSHTEERAGFRSDASLSFSNDAVPAADTIAASGIVDVTSHVKDGRLEWTAPPGDWTIVRFCHTPTGQMNAPAPEGGRGWECDKMSRAAVDAHFAALMGKVIADVGPLAGKAFKGVLADSWEAGSENWTPAFRTEFKSRRGYDPLPYLPVITGRVVGSVEMSERFLWDYRRTIGDLIAENHYAEFRELCRQHGMEFISEAPGINMPTVADELECKGRTDIPMGEFWMDGHNDSKEAAAAAHVYGKRVVAAEAFTAKTEDARWMKSPFDHKRLGDLHFSLGINRYVFHRYAHQPWLDRVPGMAMGRWGTNFERTNTWWEQGRAWIDYITRCQYLLQRGLPVADVCYFYGENVPNTLARAEPPLPAGYDYDVCNAEVLLTRTSVRDGRLTLPDGVSYGVLWLADSDRMTPAVARKIRELVAAGATVVGRKPERSPSLVGFPECDDEVRRIAEEVWGDCDGRNVKEHRYGAGRVVDGRPIAAVLQAAVGAPDFSANGKGKFAAIHRRIDAADVYFVSSQNGEETTAYLNFRTTNGVPELWFPDTATVERCAEYSVHDGITTLPLHFDPAGSVFVVFRGGKSASAESVVSLVRDDAEAAGMARVSWANDGHITLTTAAPGHYALRTTSGRTLTANVAPVAPLELTGPWTLAFPSGWGAPAQLPWPKLVSWTESADEGVKYFSGTATYRQDFDLPSTAWTEGRSLWLDLGAVKEVAEVKINGRDLGVLWKPPFRVDMTAAARPGRNTVEIRVTNLWPNRMIGDTRLPEKQRHTWSTFNPFKPDSPLLPSGLLGPVRIVTETTVTID